ncbi:MAG TPA: hypothetical protein VLQ79_13515, partial [Myxococcaceae bacterium]|nr:hypothetical protein [Myxococcaceae bacterium]
LYLPRTLEALTGSFVLDRGGEVDDTRPRPGPPMSVAAPLLLLTFLVGPAPASTEVPASSSPLSEDAAVAPLWKTLEAEQGPDRVWYWSWSGGLAAVALGQSIMVAVSSERATQINGYVNVPASALGSIATLLDPPAAAYGFEDVRVMPEATPAQRAAKAAAIQGLFQRSVKQERFYRSALNHVIGLTVNAGLAAILYFGFKLGGRALLTLVGGTISWEAQIFTRPTHALDHADGAAAGDSGAQGLRIVPTANGFAVAGSF